jgi:proteasome lid subunit RPN8/RPN11
VVRRVVGALVRSGERVLRGSEAARCSRRCLLHTRPAWPDARETRMHPTPGAHSGRPFVSSIPVAAPRHPSRADEVRISADAYRQVVSTVGRRTPESGGPLGGASDTGLLTSFFFDDEGSRTPVEYSPAVDRIRRIFREVWRPRGTRMRAYVHSHPGDMTWPSEGDRAYAAAILRSNEQLERLGLLIVTRPGSAPTVTAWLAERDGRLAAIHPARLVVDGEETAWDALPFDLPVSGPRLAGHEACTAVATYEAMIGRGWTDPDPTFERVIDAYDLSRMSRSRGVFIGTGGARAFITDLARAGLGEIVLVDPDVVTASNIATQHVRASEIGQAKVDALRREIAEIAPNAHVEALQLRLEDIPSAELRRLLSEPLRPSLAWSPDSGSFSLVPAHPERTVLFGLTDNFAAQARVNELAIEYTIPSLSAQLYREGRGAEVTFTFPGVTQACHRCMLEARYRAYEAGYRNDVGSAGAPIVATSSLNALKELIALAMFHHGSDHPRWGSLLERIGDRTLVLLRLDPDLSATLGVGAFDRALSGVDTSRFLLGEALWLKESVREACPACGGRGVSPGLSAVEAPEPSRAQPQGKRKDETSRPSQEKEPKGKRGKKPKGKAKKMSKRKLDKKPKGKRGKNGDRRVAGPPARTRRRRRSGHRARDLGPRRG